MRPKSGARWPVAPLRSTALVLLLAALVVGSATAIGGAHNGVVIVLGLLACIAAALAAAEPPSMRRPSLAPTVVLLVLSAYCFIQTVPLPLPLLERLSPAAADIWARSLFPIGGSVMSAPLSLDPGASTLEGLKWATYAVAFRVSSLVARRRGADAVFLIILTSAVIVALATVGHELIGARKVWGLYKPRSYFEFIRVGPFLNPNSLAGYLNLGALAGLGLLQTRRPVISPWIVGTAVVIVVAVAFRSASRGAVLALPLGVLITGALVWVARYGKARSVTRSNPLWPAYAAMLGAIVLGIGFAALAADDAFWKDLVNTNTDKLRMSSWTKPVIADFPWFGIGRGTFESVFLAYRPEMPSHLAFIHPENFAAQWVSEWGLLVGGLALLGLVWGFRPTNVGATKSALNAAGFAAVAVVLLQNLLDLGLELPGISVAISATLGALWGDLRVRRPIRPVAPTGERVLGSALMGLCTIATALSVVRASTSLADDRDSARQLLELARTDASRRSEADAAVRDGLLRHPADYYFPLLGAMYAVEFRTGSPMPWLQRALERGPNVGRTHLLLAEVLLRSKAHKQGMLELRLAVEFEPGLAAVAGQAAVRHSRDMDVLLIAVPAGTVGANVLDWMAASVNDVNLRENLDREAIAREPSVVQPRERVARRRIDALDHRRDPCIAPEPCMQEIAEQADALAQRHPRSSRGAQLHALLAIRRGEPHAANEILLEACLLPLDALSCLELHAQVAPNDVLSDVLERHASHQCVKRSTCAASLEWAASVYAFRGMQAQAYGAAKRAAEQEPTVERWVQAANYAEASRNLAATAHALEQALRAKGDDDAELRSRLTRIRLGRKF